MFILFFYNDASYLIQFLFFTKHAIFRNMPFFVKNARLHLMKKNVFKLLDVVVSVDWNICWNFCPAGRTRSECFPYARLGTLFGHTVRPLVEADKGGGRKGRRGCRGCVRSARWDKLDKKRSNRGSDFRASGGGTVQKCIFASYASAPGYVSCRIFLRVGESKICMPDKSRRTTFIGFIMAPLQ